MTSFVNKNNLRMVYLFCYLHTKLNKANGQIRYLKVKNVTFNGWREYVKFKLI